MTSIYMSFYNKREKDARAIQMRVDVLVCVVAHHIFIFVNSHRLGYRRQSEWEREANLIQLTVIEVDTC